jgi:hypothetical protein
VYLPEFAKVIRIMQPALEELAALAEEVSVDFHPPRVRF